MKEVAVCPYDYAQTKGTVITGTGRAGTSFLIALLSTLKMPTGFTAPQAQSYLSNPAHAGLERMQTCKCHDNRTNCLVFSTQVQIVKSPYLAMDKWFPIWLTPTIQPLSNVIVPIRDSKETSISRANNNNTAGAEKKMRIWLMKRRRQIGKEPRSTEYGIRRRVRDRDGGQNEKWRREVRGWRGGRGAFLPFLPPCSDSPFFER